MGLKYIIVFLNKDYNKYYVLHILHIFVYSMYCHIFKFSIDE